jgi:hypothetical protein
MHPHLKLRCRKKTHKLQKENINAKLLHAKGHKTHQILSFTRSRSLSLSLSLATEFRSPLCFERERRRTTVSDNVRLAWPEARLHLFYWRNFAKKAKLKIKNSK